MSAPKRCCVRCGADISHRALQARYCSKQDNPECFGAGNRAAVRKTRQKEPAGSVGPCGDGHRPEVGLCRRCGTYCTEARRRGATRPDRSYPKRRPRSLPKLPAASRKLTKDEIRWLNKVAPWSVSPAYARQDPSPTMAPASLGRELAVHERWAEAWRGSISRRQCAAAVNPRPIIVQTFVDGDVPERIALAAPATNKGDTEDKDDDDRGPKHWGDPNRNWLDEPGGLIRWREREAALHLEEAEAAAELSVEVDTLTKVVGITGSTVGEILRAKRIREADPAISQQVWEGTLSLAEAEDKISGTGDDLRVAA